METQIVCFYILAIVSSAAVSMGVHLTFWLSALSFFGKIPSNGIAGSRGSPIFSFLRNHHAVFHSEVISLYGFGFAFPWWLMMQIIFLCTSLSSVEKAVASHSSTLVWKILWAEEPGRLQSMGLQRVGYNWVTSLSLFTFMHWRSKWQPTPVLLPGESQGRRSLVGCHLWVAQSRTRLKCLSSSSSGCHLYVFFEKCLDFLLA